MASYTSAQAGDLSSDASWNESGHPNANNDTMTITHAIAYDIGDSSITWGNVNINSGGTLTFPTDEDSKILLNSTGLLTINSGGKLKAGSLLTPIDSSYTFKLHITAGTVTTNRLIINDGGEIEINGDPDFYGNERYAYLDNDWTTGQSFYVTGDRSDWQVNQKIYIHENKNYSNYQSDGHIYTISAISSYDSGNDRTQITISETAPGKTFTAVLSGYKSKIIMLSRNVEIGDPAIGIGIVRDYGSNTERLRFDNNQVSSKCLININDAVVFGWDQAIGGGYNYRGKNLCFVNNNYGMRSSTDCFITCDFISNAYAVSYGTNCHIKGDFCSCYTALDNMKYSQIEGNILSSHLGSNKSLNCQVIGGFISNNYAIYKGNRVQVSSDFIGNSNNTYATASSTEKLSIVMENSVMSSTKKSLRIYENSGVLLPLVSGDTHWQTPVSGNDWILECTPYSYCDEDCINRIEMNPLEAIGRRSSKYVTTIDSTFSIKIYPVGWSTALNQDDVYLEVLYLDSTGAHRKKITNSSTSYANGGWRDVSVTISPGQDGILYYKLHIKNYESGAYILIDPIPSVS